MDAIAAATRISKVTLYARFPDKESLLRAVVEDRAAAHEVRAFDRVLAGAPVHLARVLYEVRYNYMVDIIAKDIEDFTRSDTKAVRNSRLVALDLMALVTGSFRMQSMVGVVTKRKAIEYAHHAVDVVMAARATW